MGGDMSLSDEEPAPTSTTTIDSLNDSRFRVVEPIHVRLYVGEDGWVVAGAPDEFNYWYGDGKSIEEAISDLQASLIELYLDLEEDAKEYGLGTHLRGVYEAMSRQLVYTP